MKPHGVRSLYDDECASTYNELWHGGVWASDTRQLLEAIRRRVTPGVRWLDVGCGTGYFLSQFPGVDRAGFDMSPSMLAQARVASPDALFFREGDFRRDVPEWQDRWSLVTCTGEPYSYVDSLDEIEALVANMARWTAFNGMCAVAIQDVTDLSGVYLPYPIDARPSFDGEILIEAVVWSMTGGSDRPEYTISRQDHLLWPTLEHWIATFGRYFRHIEVEHLPHDPAFLATPRRLLVATEKREPEDTQQLVLTYTGDMAPPTGATPSTDAPRRKATAEIRKPGETERPLRIRDLPLGHVMYMSKPWTRRFWRAVANRVRAGRRTR